MTDHQKDLRVLHLNKSDLPIAVVITESPGKKHEYLLQPGRKGKGGFMEKIKLFVTRASGNNPRRS